MYQQLGFFQLVRLLYLFDLLRECPIPLFVQIPSLHQQKFQINVLVIGSARKTHGVDMQIVTPPDTMENLE
jgi:hypothetical protein